jgi:2-polyprenyl-3-methyl-5-hydroxy-6-metoxy-1,4-benzoquinol methylase
LAICIQEQNQMRFLSSANLLNPRWWLFEWRYWRRKTPWDTNITPPEVMEFLANTRSGRALDLGCGTGTNAITLCRHGWQVTGIDFSPKAINTARRKATQAGLTIDFRVDDVSDLTELTGLFDYALDIGCLFTLKEEGRRDYSNQLSRLLRPGATYMLYAWLPRPWRGRIWGITPEEVRELFVPEFREEKTVVGEEKGAPSAWYWLVRAESS